MRLKGIYTTMPENILGLRCFLKPNLSLISTCDLFAFCSFVNSYLAILIDALACFKQLQIRFHILYLMILPRLRDLTSRSAKLIFDDFLSKIVGLALDGSHNLRNDIISKSEFSIARQDL